MFIKSTHGHKGFTLVEILVVLGIALVVSSISMTALSSLSSYQSLDKDTDVSLSYVEKAREQTIESKNFSSFGVHFSSSSVSLFQGTTYSASASTTMVYNLSSKVNISSISLTGGVSDIYFNKISGEPSATGTISFQNKPSASTTKKIVVYGTGLAEIQ
jgi:prepilin-type N-terminal cleavage/methylation domain-containing protein